MSTNYYVDFKMGDSNSGGAVSYRMHIGKAVRSTAGYGISTFCGRHFADVESWVKFLRHNVDCATVVDEQGLEKDTEEFIGEFLESPVASSADQIAWLNAHRNDPKFNLGSDSLKIWDEPQPDAWRARYWIDSATGKLFYGGEFF